RAGDRIRVDAGATIPCDGEVARGYSAVVEAILTGEQQPVSKRPGSPVSAGTITVDHPLEVIVHQVGAGTRLGAILDLVDGAGASRPQRSTVADRVVNWFVGTVLVVSVAVFWGWWLVAPDKALWVTLSVLVVTCPCALALATPTALTVATGVLRRRGFLIRDSGALETLARVSTAVLDKTGTLTLGNMRISGVEPLADLTGQQTVALAAALEKGSTHPIARAFADSDGLLPAIDGQRFTVGQGVEGICRGRACRFGKPAFAMALSGRPVPPYPDGEGRWLLLADDSGALGWIGVEDALRPGAAAAIGRLRELGLTVELLSGDHPRTVGRVAEQLAIGEWRGDASPEGKLARIRHLQEQGNIVLMVGDGINDVPVLSGSDVSVAMGDAVDITRLHADSLLMSGNLHTLADAVTVARRTRAIIRQNHGWAIGYNLVALPLAAAGMVPPWLAAIGMSVSSLLVVLNALRLGRVERAVRAGSVELPGDAVAVGAGR
ncbi:MAG: heavy metal translocating P-type ATPase, partial [Bacteroidales bacterium]|nr:heavy metal translocating P-type ATPase [Bacteroidales bacterium]